MDLLADTTFLVGRWRNGPHGPEQAFIESHPDDVLGIPWIVKGEFLRGAILAGHEEQTVARFLDRYRVAWPDDQTIIIYARVYAELSRRNALLGPHDLWIAAAALRCEIPILTAHRSEFQRVPRLRIADYLQPR